MIDTNKIKFERKQKLSQKDCLERFDKVWRNTYDYSLVKYKIAHAPVKIICKKHGIFEQVPKNHWRGQGCRLCNRSRRLTLEEFIFRANNKHDHIYDYSAITNIKNSHSRVNIKCKKHGFFSQKAYHHLNGSGCPKCSIHKVSKMQTLDKDQVVKRFKKAHGDRYDYSLVEYISQSDKIKIICKEHKIFEQTPIAHWSGQGCALCNGGRLLEKNEFVKKCEETHGNLYDYSLTDYKKSKDHVKIICRKHGIFEQAPKNHWRGQGCPKCGINKRTKTQTFTNSQAIKKFKNVHKNRYDYSLVEYKTAHAPVKIICKKHGIFEQAPYTHWNGRGCLKCTRRGFSQKAIEWLNHISGTKGLRIQHAMNEGEYLIPGTKYHVDGWCSETSTCYEFLGDFWHGNIDKYNNDEVLHPNGKSVKECYKSTMDRLEKIENLGYNIKYIWENDWDKMNRSKI